MTVARRPTVKGLDGWPVEMTVATAEEVAEHLSLQEGSPVSAEEVRRIEAGAFRKLRKILAALGLTPANLLPGD